LPQEPAQKEARKQEIRSDVPLDALYKAYHMASRNEDGYYFAELITEVLGGGNSSRLHQSLVKEKKLFSAIECHQTGSVDAGLLVIEGRLIKGVNMIDADKAIEEEIEKMRTKKIEEKELTKVKNKTESAILFEDMSLMNRAASLAIYELLGDANMMNTELARYQSVTAEQILAESRKIFDEKNSSTLYYYSNN
jgi:zinc protease